MKKLALIAVGFAAALLAVAPVSAKTTSKSKTTTTTVNQSVDNYNGCLLYTSRCV